MSYCGQITYPGELADLSGLVSGPQCNKDQESIVWSEEVCREEHSCFWRESHSFIEQIVAKCVLGAKQKQELLEINCLGSGN